jgi:hypothetical protein
VLKPLHCISTLGVSLSVKAQSKMMVDEPGNKIFILPVSADHIADHAQGMSGKNKIMEADFYCTLFVVQ